MSEVDRIGDANVDDGCTWKEEYKRLADLRGA